MRPESARNTQLFLWIAVIAAIGFDIWWAVNGVSGDTISEVTKSYAWRWATIPLMFGVLTGHLFWSMHGPIHWHSTRLMILVFIVAWSAILDVVDVYDVTPIIPVLAGIMLGHVLWPQAVSDKRVVFVWKR